MRLSATRQHWNGFAERDPFWAILTEDGKLGHGWKTEEFFATGEAAIRAELTWVQQHLPSLRRGRALDFGCGVGRLTQALAAHFDEVVGLDLAEKMLELAQRHNRHPERVHYRHNTEPHLGLFASGSFDYVTSDITLQHMAPRYARQYIAEFVRICAPGGAICFQLPAYVPPARKERFKFSWWPPTLWKRICRFTRRGWEKIFPPEPVMEVYAIPREEVISLLETAGAVVVAIEANTAAGSHIESFRYLATLRSPAGERPPVAAASA